MTGVNNSVVAGGAGSPARLRALCLSAAVGIRNECDKVLGARGATRLDGGSRHSHGGTARANGDDGCGDVVATSLDGCGEPLVHLLSRQASRIAELYESRRLGSTTSPVWLPAPTSLNGLGHAARGTPESDSSQQTLLTDGLLRDGEQEDDGDNSRLVLKRLDDLISIAYNKFYAYLYKDLPLCWRQLYTDAAILKFSLLLLYTPLSGGRQRRWSIEEDAHAASRGPRTSHNGNITIGKDGCLLEMVRTLDLALILAGAGGHSRGRSWIDHALELLESACTELSPDLDGAADHAGLDTTICDSPPPAKKARLDGPAHLIASWEDQPSFSTHEPFTPVVRHPIPRVSADANGMDMSAFQRHLDDAPRDVGPTPIVLTGLVDHWPARSERPWAKPAYLLSRTFGGRRLVPVEIGRSYVDEGWGQKILTFEELLTEHIDPSSSSSCIPDDTRAHTTPRPTAYLAQHQLLQQLPQLRSDVTIPDHCYTAPPPHPTDPSQDQPELEEPLLNAWFGPPGTITPLHTDPYHNLLVQVVGRKYVRLYAPGQSGRMRARGKEGGVEMGNTSLWDVGVEEGWDAAPGGDGSDDDGDDGDDDNGGGGEGPDRVEAVAGVAQRAVEEEAFGDVPFVDCILEPGDTLYIPIGWWHYVRGLSVSFSVSIWWN